MKIKSSELRLGNFVFDDEGIASEISRIETERYTRCNSGEDSCLHFQEINAKDDYCNGSVYPIPLNEEWLFKFGFFKFNNAYVLEEPKEDLFDFKFSVWYDMTYNSSEFNIKLDSVHQLQNLYFALMSTELELVVS